MRILFLSIFIANSAILFSTEASEKSDKYSLTSIGDSLKQLDRILSSGEKGKNAGSGGAERKRKSSGNVVARINMQWHFITAWNSGIILRKKTPVAVLRKGRAIAFGEVNECGDKVCIIDIKTGIHNLKIGDRWIILNREEDYDKISNNKE
jgi:hypothetical protein